MSYKSIFTWLATILILIAFLGSVFSSQFFLYAYYLYAFAFFLLVPVIVLVREKSIGIEKYKFKYFILLSIFLTHALFTAYFSQDPLLTISRVAINFLPLFAFALLYSQSDSYRTTRILMSSFALITVFSAFFVVILHLFGDRNFVEGQGWINSIGPFYQRQFGLAPFYRYAGLFNNPNSFALWILFALAAYEFTRFKYNKKRSYWIYIIYLMLLFLIFSRAGMLSILIFYSILSLLLSKKSARPLAIVSAGVALLSVALLYLTVDFSFNSSSISGNRLNFSLSARDEVWRILLDSIANNPLGGIGFGVSNESLLQGAGFNFSAHSLHLQMLSETGIIGYVLFILIYFYPIFVAYKRKNRLKSDLVLIAFLIAFLIHQFFENTLFRGGMFHIVWFFFSYVLLCGTEKISSMSNEKSFLLKS